MIALLLATALSACGQSVTGVDDTTSSTVQTENDEWDRIVEHESVTGNLVITPGERWLIGADVEVAGNVLVEGSGTVLGMRPGSSLKLIGGDPEKYVGGNDLYTSKYANDIGIWVWDGARVDIRGTPKASWNRTGTDPTWESDDEYWIAPTNTGDTEPKRWHPGDPIPQVDPRVPPAEVVNVTRDVLIEGPGHIHIRSQVPQRIEYARIENMGVLREGGPVLGRYAIHLHFGGEGMRGTVIRGVALVNSRGRGFVPHESDGVTMIDNVSLNGWAEQLWWDIGDDTNDLLVDRMAIVGVGMPREILGETPRFDAFTLGSGHNMEIRNSVAAGVCCDKLAVGFDWVSGGQAPNPVWIFEKGNVAHNNGGPGLRFWTNLGDEHDVRDYVSYRNEDGGIENGAYRNRVSFYDSILLDDFFFQQSNSKGDPVQTIENVYVESPREAMRVGHRSLPPQAYAEIIDATLIAGDGYPKVYVQTGNNPWHAHFIRSGVTPDDFAFEDVTAPEMQGTSVLIDHADGRKWEIRIEDNGKTVSERVLTP